MKENNCVDDDFIDITSGDLFPILETIDQGIIMTDKDGIILYYNKSHAKMDGLDKDSVKGLKMTEVYHLDKNTSLIMRCLKKNKAILNFSSIYTTRNGRVVNSINNIYPLRKNGQLIGAMSFVKDYEYLDGIINKIDGAYKKTTIINETRFTFRSIVGSTPPLLEMENKAKLASNSPSPIMFYGETGTGKELFAQAIHNYSYRKRASYMAVNCAAIPETLLEGILFGTTKGSYTGAINKPGLFEQANGGTIFLDEINSMPISLQSKLLRVLQEKKVRRIGAKKEIVLDLKIISSTNELPQKEISKGNLRKDFFYRLGVVFLAIPPLRKRLEDIAPLTDHFIRKYNKIMGKKVQKVSAELRDHFQTYKWPGNVRELENIIEGAMNMVGSGNLIKRRHMVSEEMFLEKPKKTFENATDALEDSADAETHGNHSRKTVEITNQATPLKREPAAGKAAKKNMPQTDETNKEKIIQTLIHCLGSAKKTSEKLNISRQTLHKKIKKYSINRERILENIEKGSIEKSLFDAKGNITVAAQHLSISRQLLNYKMKKYDILKSSFK